MSKTTKTKVPKQKTGLAYRILSALILIACVGVVFLPISTFQGSLEVKSQSIIETIKAMINGGEMDFGFLPVIKQSTGVTPFVMSAAFYTFVLALVIAVILNLISIFSKKAAGACFRSAIFFIMWGSIVYTLSIVCITAYAEKKFVYDLYTAIIAGASMLIYFILAFVKLGKGGWIAIFHFILTFVACGLFVVAISMNGFNVSKAINVGDKLYKKILLVLLVIAAIHLFISTFRAMSKGALGCKLFGYALQVVIALAACYVGYAAGVHTGTYLLYCVIAALVSTIQILIGAAQISKAGKALAAQSAEEALARFETEEYVEAYLYEGGPVAGVEIAEEVNPSAASAAYGTNGKPTLNDMIGNGFDPFLFTLTDEEKAEFIDLYILKCKTNMPEIPTYVVGGNNKDFFNKVFIYLGQYREKVSSNLLAKMYKFSMKLS